VHASRMSTPRFHRIGTEPFSEVRPPPTHKSKPHV